ncbi:MAG: hypothetical protein AAF677_17430, partial [Pseudomonadota bacterium]
MPDSAFPDTLTAYFATNRSLRRGVFGNGFYDGDPKLFRVGEAALDRQGGAWQLGDVTVYPERTRSTGDNERPERAWTVLGSDHGFEMMRTAG